MVPVLFWILFAITCAFIAWGFLRMFYEILRDAFAERKNTGQSETGGTSGGSVDVSAGFAAESSESGSDSSSEGSGGFESGGGESGGGGASGGW